MAKLSTRDKWRHKSHGNLVYSQRFHHQNFNDTSHDEMNEKEDPLTCVLDGYLGYSQSYSRVMRAKPQTKAFFLTHHA